MKKLVLSAFGSFVAFGVMAQDDALKEVECKALRDAVAKNVKSTENTKKPAKSSAWVSLGDAYVDLAQRCTDDSSAVEKAENAYKKALEVENAAGGKKSKDIEAALNGEKLGSTFLMQGAGYYNSKNYKKAAEYFGKSAEINTKDTTAYLYAGIANQMLENSANATKYLNGYITAGGKDPSVFYSLAQIYRSEKKFDEAEKILMKGIETVPNNKDLSNEVVNVYVAAKNYDKAAEYLEKITKKDPSDITSLTNLALIYDQKSQDFNNEINKLNSKVNEASTEKLDKKLVAEQDKLAAYEGEITSLNAKLKREPKTAVATKKRIAEVTEQKAEIEKEINTLISEIQAKKSNSGEIDGLKAKAQELGAKQKQEKSKAVDNYNKVLAIEPNNFEVLYNLAVMHYNDAVEIKKPVDNMDIATYRKEGKAIEQKACEQFGVAKPYFERALAVKPEDNDIKENLSNLKQILEQCSK